MAGILLAASMDMASFKTVARRFSPEITIRIRGRHGIGKSQCVYQLASDYRSDFYKDQTNSKATSWSFEQGLPVVEVRLSQCTEGDVQGLPVLDGVKTSFKAVDWLVKCCKQPCVLFLDELNRAIPQVEQAVFQLLDSHRFGEYPLHPDTRIFVAENIGEIYQVGQVDPAELSRCAVIDLDPTVDDWLTWAKEHCNQLLVDFIRANKNALEVDGKAMSEPQKKTPDRRAWARLDTELTRSGLYSEITSQVFYHMSASMIGLDFAQAWWDYCKNHDKMISAEDILKSWAKCKAKLGDDVAAEKFIELVNKLGDHLKKVGGNLTNQQTQQVVAFLKDCPAEPRVTMWAALYANTDLLRTVTSMAGDLMVRTVTGGPVTTGTTANTATPAAPVAAPKTRKLSK
jgi:hypothetical protein